MGNIRKEYPCRDLNQKALELYKNADSIKAAQ